MRKTNSKLFTTSKFVRKVLSRTSWTLSNENLSQTKQDSGNTSKVKSDRQTKPLLQIEVTNLKEQLGILQTTVNNMQEEAEKKEKVLANLAREKEKLSTELRREKRSTTSLKQQLKEEREFYFKEKEQYCEEMNNCKKIKKALLEGNQENSKEHNKLTLTQYKNQVTKLKETLRQTLEVNYNLSLKFLKMKNTKSDLKQRLHKQEAEHTKALTLHICNIRNEVTEVVEKQLTQPISPSSKKYLQIVKQNGTLLHENLQLQMELAHLKASKSKETIKRGLKLIANGTSSVNDVAEKSETRLIKSKRPKETQEKCKEINHKEENLSQVQVIQIYKRKETEDIPGISLLPQEFTNSENVPGNDKLKIRTIDGVSEISTGLSVSSETIHTTQSAPEIVQTSLFVSENKL